MKNKGFTLIELLAVIVILAIIALIAVPIILDIIGDTKSEANKRSIDLYGKSIELAVARKSITEEVPVGNYKTSGNKLTLEDNDFSLDIEYDGERVECTIVQLHDNMSIGLGDCKVDGKKINYTYGMVYLDYLESTGTQYIDTGFVPNYNTKVEIKFMITKLNFDSFVYGSRTIMNGNDVHAAGIYRTMAHVIFQFNADRGNMSKPIELNRNYVIINDKTGGYLDDEILKKYTYTDFQGTFNLYLYGINTGGMLDNSQTFSGKIYYCKIYDGETLVRDFIPVLDKEGTPCLYDKVEKKFYYNQGTGEFEYK